MRKSNLNRLRRCSYLSTADITNWTWQETRYWHSSTSVLTFILHRLGNNGGPTHPTVWSVLAGRSPNCHVTARFSKSLLSDFTATAFPPTHRNMAHYILIKRKFRIKFNYIDKYWFSVFRRMFRRVGISVS